MTGGLAWARKDVEARALALRSVWRDAAADHYLGQIHGPVTEVLDHYFRALGTLEDAVEQAEIAARF